MRSGTPASLARLLNKGGHVLRKPQFYCPDLSSIDPYNGTCGSIPIPIGEYVPVAGQQLYGKLTRTVSSDL